MFETIAIIAIIYAFIRMYKKILNDPEENSISTKPMFLKNRDYDREGFYGYANGWYFLMASNELKTNEVKAISLCEQEFALFRGSSNKVYALSAYCPHLGANIANGGKAVNLEGMDCIQCPFDGWVFNGTDGKCIKIPNIEHKDIPKNAYINSRPILEQDHLIYFWYDEDYGEPIYFPYCFGKSEYDMTQYTKTDKIVTCNSLEISWENTFDQEHFTFLHHYIIGSFLTMNYKTESHVEGDGRYVLLTGELLLFNTCIGTMRDTLHVKAPIIASHLTVKILFFRMKFRVIVSLIPLAPMKTRMQLYFFTPPSFWMSKFSRLLTFMLSYQVVEDLVVWADAKTPKKPVFTTRDKPIIDCKHYFQKHCSKPLKTE